MEYLKEKFESDLTASLSDEGKTVYIGDTEFSAAQILTQMDPNAFENAFSDWLDQERGNKIEFANDILQRFDCQDRFNRLVACYKQKNVIPFVGAGMSVASGYKTWTTFLTSCVRDCSQNQNQIGELIRSSSLEDAAELIMCSMPTGAFLEKINASFAEKDNYLGCVRKLPHLFDDLVITTNFDPVLENIYRNHGKHFKAILLGTEASDLPRIAQETSGILVKLHGQANSARNRVFTKSEYETHYKDSENIKAIVEFSCSRSLLFMGSSLISDRFFQHMVDLVKKRGSENIPYHYAFIKLNAETERNAIRDHLASANIFPIFYDGEHDECIDAFLEKLIA